MMEDLPPWGATPCAPGLRDDDWFLPLNVAPCSLPETARTVLLAVLLALSAVCLVESLATRLVLRADKSPTSVWFLSVLIYGTCIVGFSYMLAFPGASVRRAVDVVLLYLVGCIPLLLLLLLIAFAVAHLVKLSDVALSRSGRVTEDLGLISGARVQRGITTLNLVMLAVMFVLVVVFMFIMPSVKLADPVEEDRYITIAYILILIDVDLNVLTVTYAIYLSYTVVYTSVRFVVHGIEARHVRRLDFKLAATKPNAANLLDMYFRLRFLLVLLGALVLGVTGIFVAIIILGQRWYLYIALLLNLLLGLPAALILLFKPRLVPHFLRVRLGIHASSAAQGSLSGGVAGDGVASSPTSLTKAPIETGELTSMGAAGAAGGAVSSEAGADDGADSSEAVP